MSLWSWIKGKLFPSSVKGETHSFAGSPIDLIMGTDFEIGEWRDPQGVFWAKITYLRGEFVNTSIKFNQLKLVDVTENDGATLMIDYDFINLPSMHTKKSLSKSKDFNNMIFNTAFTLLSLQLTKMEQEQKEEDDIYDDADDDAGRNDSGKPDSE